MLRTNPRISAMSDVEAKRGLIFREKDYELLAGSKLQRIANANEPIDSRHKYVILRPDDLRIYKYWWKDMECDYSQHVVIIHYLTERDLRIASTQTVIHHIVDKYGTDYIKDHEDVAYLALGRKPSIIDSKSNSKLNKCHHQIRNFLIESMYMHRFDIINWVNGCGYDGMMDVEDIVYRFANAPLIIFNPKQSLKHVKQKDFSKRAYERIGEP